MSKPNKVQIRNSTAEFLIFTTQAGEKSIEVRVEEQTVWLTQKLIGALFDVDVRTVSEHLQNIFNSGELTESAVIWKFRNTASDGKSYLTAFYNLDAIIAVGFRVQSARIPESHRVFSPKCLADAPLLHSALATRFSFTTRERNQKIRPFTTSGEIVNAA